MMEKQNNQAKTGGLPPAEPCRLEKLIDYSTGSIVSRTLVRSKAGTVTIFAFDEGQELSEHSAPFDAIIQVLDGDAQVTIGGEAVLTHSGETVLMPADIPHAVRASTRMKMMLIMIRG